MLLLLLSLPQRMEQLSVKQMLKLMPTLMHNSLLDKAPSSMPLHLEYQLLPVLLLLFQLLPAPLLLPNAQLFLSVFRYPGSSAMLFLDLFQKLCATPSQSLSVQLSTDPYPRPSAKLSLLKNVLLLTDKYPRPSALTNLLPTVFLFPGKSLFRFLFRNVLMYLIRNAIQWSSRWLARCATRRLSLSSMYMLLPPLQFTLLLL